MAVTNRPAARRVGLLTFLAAACRSPYCLSRMTQQAKLISAIIASTVLIFGGLTYLLMRAPSDSPTPNGTIVFDDADAISVGKADAAVVVRMYSDFQCPACRSVEPVVKAIRTEFADRVRFIWKDFPLMQIHKNARNAANAARCANAQGKFWEYHDRLFDTQDAWSSLGDPKDRFVQFARETGLNEGDFTTCYNRSQFDGDVMDDVDEGEKNGVDSTPTFYVNNTEVRPRSEAEWRVVLNAALQQAATAPSPSPTSTVPTTSSTNSTLPVATSTQP